jgi:hypothetical protein
MLMRARQKETRPAFLPPPSCGAEAQILPNLKKISLGFANPPPAKLLRKTESAFALAFPRTFHSWKALCFAQRRVARGERYSFFWKKVRAKCIISSQSEGKANCFALPNICEAGAMLL